MQLGRVNSSWCCPEGRSGRSTPEDKVHHSTMSMLVFSGSLECKLLLRGWAQASALEDEVAEGAGITVTAKHHGLPCRAQPTRSCLKRLRES